MSDSRSGGGSIRLVLGGTATKHCVHDRIKSQVKTEKFAAELLLEATGIVYDSRLHKLHLCSCCDNLFWSFQTEPRYCDLCTGPLVHPLGGPLAEPKGVVG